MIQRIMFLDKLAFFEITAKPYYCEISHWLEKGTFIRERNFFYNCFKFVMSS